MKVTSDIVAGFVGSVLAPKFDNATAIPEFHHEMWDLCCSNEKFVAIAAPRDHAKSTAVTLGYGLATLLFRERKFMLLVSDTEAQANMFLGNIKSALQENDELIALFGLKRNEKGLVSFVKDSESDIIVAFEDGYKFRIIAKGAQQKLRGLNWDGSRPDIIICDDIENDESVMNPETRKKFKRWFNAALLPCRSVSGIVRIVGTILHSDSLLEGFMPNPRDKKTVTEDLRQWTTARRMWKAVKYRAHDELMEKLLWPDRKTVQEFKMLREQATIDGTLDSYSQEYLNIPVDESTSYFRKQDLLTVTDSDFKKNVRFYITCDLAISQSETADYSVFMIAAVDEDRTIQIRDVVRERLDGREIVDTLLALHKAYNPEVIGIEEMQVSKAIGPFLREEMIRQNNFINLLPLKHGGKDKISRAKSIQARMRARTVKFDKSEDWYPALEQEIVQFPRGRHDDQVDCLAYLGLLLDKLIEAPTREELDEDEYQHELAQSDLAGGGGRSEHTGY